MNRYISKHSLLLALRGVVHTIIKRFPILLIAHSALAQTTFLTGYGLFPGAVDGASALGLTQDGGFLVAGSGVSIGGITFTYVFRTDSSGIMLWDNSTASTGDAGLFSVDETADGGCIAMGYHEGINADWNIMLFKLDSAGKKVWAELIGTAHYDLARSGQLTFDGGYVICGDMENVSTLKVDLLLCKTDGQGQVLWTRTYGAGGGHLEGQSVFQCQDGGFIVAANYWQPADSSSVILKTDSTGAVQWSTQLSSIGRCFSSRIIQTNDGGYVLVGISDVSYSFPDAWMARFDSAGTLLWTKRYWTIFRDAALDVIQASDGGYLLAGYTGNVASSQVDVLLLKTDSSGGQVWARKYGAQKSDVAHRVRQTPDGGYVAACSFYFPVTGVKSWLISLMKTDSLGQSACYESPVSMNEDTLTVSAINIALATGTGGGVLAATPYFSGTGPSSYTCQPAGYPDLAAGEGNVFPNPADDEVHLAFRVPVRNGTVQIINCLGEKMYEKPWEGKSRSSVGVRQLPPGVYLVRLTGESFVYTSRLVISR